MKSSYILCSISNLYKCVFFAIITDSTVWLPNSYLFLPKYRPGALAAFGAANDLVVWNCESQKQ